MFSDGSLYKGKCGAGICGYMNNKKIFEEKIRLADGCSTTTTEIFAMLAAVRFGQRYDTNIIIAADSTSALHSLVNRNNETNVYVERIKVLINKHKERGYEIKFTWVPSHVGIKGNDSAGKLAKEGTEKQEIDYQTPRALILLKKEEGMIVNDRIITEREKRIGTSNSLKRYAEKYNFVSPNYISNDLKTRREQLVYSRLRMNYVYLWQIKGMKKDGTP